MSSVRSYTPITIEMYVQPPPEYEGTHGCLWKLKEVRYGLEAMTESDDFFETTMPAAPLEMARLVSEPGAFYSKYLDMLLVQHVVGGCVNGPHQSEDELFRVLSTPFLVKTAPALEEGERRGRWFRLSSRGWPTRPLENTCRITYWRWAAPTRRL